MRQCCAAGGPHRARGANPHACAWYHRLDGPPKGDQQQYHVSLLLSPLFHVRPPTFRFFLRRIAVSTANFSSFFYVLPGEERRRHGENQDQCRDNDQRGVLQPDDQGEPPPNSPSPSNTKNIVQRSPHDNMKMAAVHASMSTRGCDGKEILMSMLLSPAGLTRHGMPGRFWCCCAIIGLDGPDLATLLSASTRPADGCSRPAS